jgi:hypothetical protein
MHRWTQIYADASLQVWSLFERVWRLPKVRLEWIVLILALEQIRHVRLVNRVNRPLVPSRGPQVLGCWPRGMQWGQTVGST